MQHDHHHVPVTALAFSGGGDILLAGEGNYLTVYNCLTHKLLNKILAFERQAVHGILAGNGTGSPGLLWGGAQVRYFQLGDRTDESVEITLGAVESTGDWILDASFAPACTSAAVVTAHNALWFSSPPESKDALSTRLVRLLPGSNTILYSAHIKWLSRSHCLVAAGTAFGDVIVWSATVATDNGQTTARSQTHYTFPAHEGSVFGVLLSSLLHLPGSQTETRVLASCSDDRNVKLWDISNLSVESATLAQMQRETGFGFRPDNNAGAVAPLCLAQVMGHVSRIWNVRFDVVEPQSTLKSVRSFGEDASVITWDLKMNAKHSGLPYELQHVEICAPHSGKNIWSVASSDRGRLATGGADGAIALHAERVQAEQVTEIPRSLLNTSGDDDGFKAYCYIATDLLISTTDQGRIVLLDVSTPGQPQVTVITDTLPGLRGHSVVAALRGLAFIAGTDGAVYRYVHDGRIVSKILQLERKTAGLFCSEVDTDSMALLVTSVGEQTAELLVNDPGIVNPDEAASFTARLALPTGFVVTSFAMRKRNCSRYAVVGSRQGSIATFSVGQTVEATTIEPSGVYNLIHGKEAVTALRCTNSTRSNDSHAAWIFSTGRDGTLAIHRFFPTDSSPAVQLVHQLTLPFGPNIEGLSLAPNGELQAWGFRSKHFIVYSLTTQREVMSVDCGGAHRNWTFRQTEDGAHGGTFIWTKASRLYRKTQSALPYELINAGFHGREIKAMAISPTRTGVDRQQQIVATGAEDTDIKLFRLAPSGEFKCLQTIRKHNTGIQHLRWSADGRRLFSSAGFEEFFVWKISFGVPGLEIGVVCESRHRRSGMSDLRITGFDVREEEGGSFVVTMVYSDSTVKLWRYEEGMWELLVGAEYLTACLTDVIPIPKDDPTTFVTAATDGHLTQWDAPDQQRRELDWSRRHKVHQSAIHACTSHHLPDGSSVIITGGDDNAIALTRLTTTTRDVSPMTTLIIPRAHAAAVTGLAIISLRAGEELRFWLVSAGIDQRVKFWGVHVDFSKDGVDGVEVQRLRSGFTAVADVSGVEVCRFEDGGRGLVVCGVGMDVWRVPEDVCEAVGGGGTAG